MKRTWEKTRVESLYFFFKTDHRNGLTETKEYKIGEKIGKYRFSIIKEITECKELTYREKASFNKRVKQTVI